MFEIANCWKKKFEFPTKHK